ncbi:hypothetical protein DH2020_036515 [Rehmannia glutinosa]|uniref:Glutathione peroxidase n=1 Tax=Rehmannia glutinosa TaxID=99300 RepID=A0ABR0V598_REHGL
MASMAFSSVFSAPLHSLSLPNLQSSSKSGCMAFLDLSNRTTSLGSSKSTFVRDGFSVLSPIVSRVSVKSRSFATVYARAATEKTIHDFTVKFGGQEPASNPEIKQFACTRFKAEFPIFDKVDVNGPNTAPVYQFLKSNAGGFLGDMVKWNFEKFLVDKNGKVVERYPPTTSRFR